MRNTIYIFLVFVLVFFLNLLLYIYVDSYRGLIKTIKYGDGVPYEKSVDDSYNVNAIEYSKDNSQKSELERGLLLDLGIDDDEEKLPVGETTEIPVVNKIDSEETPVREVVSVPEREQQSDIGRIASLTTRGQNIINSFKGSGYEIIEKLDKDDLLDIANEYPDEYLQYGDNDFDLYILSTRTYKEVIDMFTLLEYDMPFSLNRQNNLGNQSFYINLDRTDNKVRFIFEFDGEVYGVKVRSSNYNIIKSIINTL